MEPVERAHELAAALARHGVDPSEVAGVFRHLRAFLDQAVIDNEPPEQAVDYWWSWLETIAGSGLVAVQRSNQTEGYYRDIYATCNSNLRELQPKILAETLGWVVRLTRYYRIFGASVTRPTSGVQPAVVPVPPKPAPVDPEQQQIDDLLCQLQDLPMNRVATELDRFVNAWRALGVSAERKRVLAKAIIEKVRQAGREKASSGKKWHLELTASLQEGKPDANDSAG